RRGSTVRRPLRLLQQSFDVIEVETGARVESLGPHFESPPGYSQWRVKASRSDRGPERIVERLVERPPATLRHLLDLSGDVVIQRECDSYSHTKILRSASQSVKMWERSCLQNPCRQRRRVPDAVRHGDAGEEVAAEVEAGEGALDPAGALDEAAVPHLVLRDRPRPAADEAEGGLAAQAQRGAQLAQHRGDDLLVVPGREFRVGAPASEGGEGHVPRGRAAGEDLGREEAAEQAQPLLARRQEAEAAERVADVLAWPAERDHGDRGVGDL